MNENQKDTFITSNTENVNVSSRFTYDNSDMNNDGKSSVNSDEDSIANAEIEDILNKNQSHNVSTLTIAHVESVDAMDSNILLNEPSSTLINSETQTVIPKSVYDYATIVRQSLKTPRQNKLDSDVATVLGTSDPPPGFGFLHPQVYYLEQTRPVPLEPLQVWRGYNGHVYFSPIQVRPFENHRSESVTKSFKSVDTSSFPLIRKVQTDRSNTILSESKNQKPTAKTKKSPLKRSLHRSLIFKKKPPSEANTDDKLTSTSSELRYSRSLLLPEKEDYRKESNKMWQSVVTSAHVQTKPISKRSRNAMEDLQALQQEQSIQDPTGYNRQVLPNIRPVPKSKFVYKGLAYKETQKLPGIGGGHGSENEGNALQKPLISYNLAQAYARYEINAARAKQDIRQPPPSAVTTAVAKEHSHAIPMQTSVDIREMRKRIVRGTTLAYRPPPQSVAWTPGRGDHRSTLGSESAYYRRPSTSKSSIPQKQTSNIEMPIVTKNINQPRSSSRFMTASELFTGAS